MTDTEIEALAQGRYSDPFRVLGPHQIDSGVAATAPLSTNRHWEVNALLPGAVSAALLLNDDRLPMSNAVHPDVFTIEVPRDPGHYRIVYRDAAGEEFEIEDPYRFPTLLTAFDLHLHGEGNHFESWRMLGAHPAQLDGISGYRFAVWAPNAELVFLVANFNHWNPHQHPMRSRDGVWEIFIPGLAAGVPYKYNVRSRDTHQEQFKSDPYAFAAEIPPKTASLTTDLDGYAWQDANWMAERAHFRWQKDAISIYEVHLESWMRDGEGRFLSYRDLAHRLVEYVQRNGFTHVELLPMMEYPYGGSWGYQVTGYFAPTSRFGSPHDFMYFVDVCHQHNIGVIVDWVPGHFPKDANGLARFDGTALYEHQDPRKGEHRDWGTLIFNYGRNEVRGFLISNALFWLREYHVDGLRVDAVASMLYLDYSREAGQWIPNMYGGNENLEAISFLRRFNELAHEIPGAITIAEESTSFSGVSRPVYLNGLGFTMKWNMGWMHDMLLYFSQDPIHRKYYQNNITFSVMYSFTENFVLPVSHDEVVHGKKSLLSKMPGDEWQRFANVRAFLGYMYAHPGKKLLFMGSEIGQSEEWDYQASVRWDLLQYGFHNGLQTLVRDLNRFYKEQAPLHETDFNSTGFEWIDFHDAQNSVICFIRRADNPADFLLFCGNFTPVVREFYEVGVPESGYYQEVLNTDSTVFGGSGVTNQHGANSVDENRHGRPFHIKVTLPPLAVIAFRLKRQ